jgi:4-amino-4-deoxy-L-arabinose transferase-like glycosyltransferase
LMFILAGILIFGGLLSKGPFALYPLTVPAFYYWFINRNKSLRAISGTIIVLFTTIILSALLFLWPPAKANILSYIQMQFLPSLSGAREHVSGNHLYILGALFQQLIPVLLISVIVFLSGLKQKNIIYENKLFYFFLFIGISASFPIMLSIKQMPHYLIGSTPYYALAAAWIILPRINAFLPKLENYRKRIFAFNIILLTAILCMVSFSITRINKNGRDIKMLNDLDELSSFLPRGKIIQCNSNLYFNWQLQAYLNRFYKISITDKPSNSGIYLVDAAGAKEMSADYKKVNAKTETMFLFKKSQ